MEKKHIILTGSAGFVGSKLYWVLKENHHVIGLDLKDSLTTDAVCDISQKSLLNVIPEQQEYIIINCASIRNDYNLDAQYYYENNVKYIEKFLKIIRKRQIERIIHISSVAALDGSKLTFNSSLSCDDAYRVTKYIQEKMIVNYCVKNNVDIVSHLPSAIFDINPQADTNIGKLQLLLKYLPIFPKITVKKSITNLDGFIKFIVQNLELSGVNRFLTIELPVKTVSEIVSDLSGHRVISVQIPFLKKIAYFLAVGFEIFGKILNVDPRLTRNRVEKLFKDTSYSNFYVGVDFQSYGKLNDKNMSD